MQKDGPGDSKGFWGPGAANGGAVTSHCGMQRRHSKSSPPQWLPGRPPGRRLQSKPPSPCLTPLQPWCYMESSRLPKGCLVGPRPLRIHTIFVLFLIPPKLLGWNRVSLPGWSVRQVMCPRSYPAGVRPGKPPGHTRPIRMEPEGGGSFGFHDRICKPDH